MLTTPSLKIWLNDKTVWAFRNTLAKVGVVEPLFDTFTARLREQGLIMNQGSIVDASFVDVPRQRDSREQNGTIKTGGIAEEWKTEENVHQIAQKDTDERWTKKNGYVIFATRITSRSMRKAR
jgi:IS5 family transposase